MSTTGRPLPIRGVDPSVDVGHIPDKSFLRRVTSSVFERASVETARNFQGQGGAFHTASDRPPLARHFVPRSAGVGKNLSELSHLVVFMAKARGP